MCRFLFLFVFFFFWAERSSQKCQRGKFSGRGKAKVFLCPFPPLLEASVWTRAESDLRPAPSPATSQTQRTCRGTKSSRLYCLRERPCLLRLRQPGSGYLMMEQHTFALRNQGQQLRYKRQACSYKSIELKGNQPSTKRQKKCTRAERMYQNVQSERRGQIGRTE